MHLTAVILASGFSHRMDPKNKLFLTYQGQSFLAHSLELVAQLPCTQRILVISAADAQQCQIPENFEVVINHGQAKGLSHSVVLGTQAALGDAYLYLPVDQPLLTIEHLSPLLQAAQSNKIIYPFVNGLPTNPMIFGSLFRVDLLNLKGDRGGSQVMRQHPEATIPIHMPTELISGFQDFDTPEQYQRLVEGGFKR
ncbi:NTP transferase domain-containing protein [Agrilactobacillus yilanensis]|uniref:NTP transferase domain-containing protein n=1 Tax=Agrilactobacillus yilanensis TaxID=2485997 RepID=A0ABW4J4H7_9LACO|nr:nucleotidyltransferase family protein [Agrilactobacillus yilanensis]